ncbi:hypothetical protein AVEN_163765-1 [Araneus ventricosus]|uniref:Uncharacterized protein n=1 Tax=Araneus ventricosus TaxID=182803 RepID=A0A4Y2HNB9_ARAVE|nr:hypothetical protein AVEN_163765-1 [Araneus ventricosus]
MSIERKPPLMALWRSLGFVTRGSQVQDPIPRKNRREYGPGARCMCRRPNVLPLVLYRCLEREVPARIFTIPTLIELRQEISQCHWLREAVTSFSALARSVRQS